MSMKQHTKYNLRKRFKGFVWGLSPFEINENTTKDLLKIIAVVLLAWLAIVILL